MGAAGQPEEIGHLLRQMVRDRLDSHSGWPVSMFKLSREAQQIYQNVTGTAIDDADDIERLTVEGRPFYVTSGTDEQDILGSDILDHTHSAYDFLENSGDTANLVTYITLCKIYDELENYIDIDVFPEGNYTRILYHTGGRKPDSMLRMANEYIPVEVYNGADYLSPRSGKFDQVCDLASSDEDPVNSYPLVVNRRSDDDFKREVRSMNGTVVDTDIILTEESLYEDYEDVLSLFNLEPIIAEVPPLEDANGDPMTGEDYDDLSRNLDDVGKVTPPSDMISDIDEIKDEFVLRLRGGVQLQYVNSLYRKHSDPTKKDACLVVQAIYNILLHAESGIAQNEAISQGWEEAMAQYGRIRKSQHRKEIIIEEAASIIDQLSNERMITKRDGKLSARQAKHPQPSLSF